MALYKYVNGEKVRLSQKEETEILKKWADVDKAKQDYLESLEYVHEKRRGDYPPIGDQLDALLKQLNYMRLDSQLNLVQDLDDIIGKWLQVKEDHPKPGP